MSVLCIFAALVLVWLLRAVFVPELRLNEPARGGHRLLGHTNAVGTDIGHQTDSPRLAQINAFIKLLHHLHGLGSGKIQLSAGFLLQAGSGERRLRPLELFAQFTLRYSKAGVQNTLLGGFCLRFVADNGLFAVQQHQLRIAADLASLLGRRFEFGGNIPIFLRDESLDLPLPVHDQTGGYALHTAGRQSLLDLSPKQRADLVAHQTIQCAPRLLRVHPIHINGPGMADRILHGLFGNFMEFDAALLRRINIQHIGQMPGNGLSLAVRVGCEINHVRALGFLADARQNIAPAPNGDILHGKVVAGVYTDLRFRQVADVPLRGFDLIAFPQKFFDGLCLGRRFHDHQFLAVLRCCHSRPPYSFGAKTVKKVFPASRCISPVISIMLRLASSSPASVCSSCESCSTVRGCT